MRVVISIDPQLPMPLGRQVYEAWRQGILDKRFAGGERVPSSRELAADLGISRSTVTLAYEQLMAEGYLTSRKGAGTFVSAALPDMPLQSRRASKRAAMQPLPISLSSYGASLQNDVPLLPNARGWIDFSQWNPDIRHFPFALWKQLLMKQLRGIEATANAAIFDYTAHAAGYWPLRCEIARYLARCRAVVCQPEQVIITNGSQQGLDLTARIVLNKGDKVVIENPCYIGARHVFESVGAHLLPGSIDQAGMQCPTFQQNLRLVYVTPSHQYPLGVSMSLARRLELLAWAREHRVLILEDDYDSEFRYHGPPLPSLQGLGNAEPVLYCGTFSKIMFPGLRLGYLVVPAKLAPVLTRAKWLTDRHTPVLEQAALAEFIASGQLEKHVRRMRKLYGARRDALVSALHQHFPGEVEISGIDAGMHALIRLDDPALPMRAQQARVHLRNAASSYIVNAPSNEYLFGFSSLSERVIREGIKRIARP
jgi:GntR family transcriptional regulator/MocR family aminotransferase